MPASSPQKDARPARLNGSYVLLPDPSDPEGILVWPNPADPNEVEHRLRYGKPTRSDLLVAASQMAAYRYMVMELSQRVRNQRVSELRAALTQHTTSEGGSK